MYTHTNIHTPYSSHTPIYIYIYIYIYILYGRRIDVVLLSTEERTTVFLF